MVRPNVNILQTANDLVFGERNDNYGDPADDYAKVATLWSTFLSHKITPREAAICMMLIKVSREGHVHKLDNLIDMAGYAQVAAECAAMETEANIPSNN